MAKRPHKGQTTEAKKKNKLLNYSFQPHQIGSISTDEENQVKYDYSQMKFLFIDNKYLTKKNTEIGKRKWSGLKMKLSDSCKGFTGNYDETITPFHRLLDWISLQNASRINYLFHPPNLSIEGSPNSSKNYFVCTRKVLVFIFSSTYKTRNEDVNAEDFLICATKFQDVIYLRKFPKPKNTEGKKNIDKAKKKEKNKSNPGLSKIIDYGHIFEHNITTSDPHSKRDISLPNKQLPNLNEQFYAVMNAQFGEHNLIFSAQMDAMDGSSFVEIKTNFIPNSEQRKKNFRWKLLSCHLQCSIAGVPRMICGLRNNDGEVNTIQEYEVAALPGIAENLWSQDACFKHGYLFLSFIKERVAKDHPKTYTFYLETETNEIKCKEGGNPVLPDSYINKMPSSTV